MKVCEGQIGRVFVIRLEHGDVVPEAIERFAEEKGVSVGHVILLGGIGSFFYTGSVNIYLGIPPPQTPTLTFFIPQILWYALGVLVLSLITLMGFVFEPSFGWLVFAAMSGGAIMVSGYFIYQQFFLGPLFNISVIASAEIPINIGQMMVGLIIAIPLVRTIRRSMPSLKI